MLKITFHSDTGERIEEGPFERIEVVGGHLMVIRPGEREGKELIQVPGWRTLDRCVIYVAKKEFSS